MDCTIIRQKERPEVSSLLLEKILPEPLLRGTQEMPFLASSFRISFGFLQLIWQQPQVSERECQHAIYSLYVSTGKLFHMKKHLQISQAANSCKNPIERIIMVAVLLYIMVHCDLMMR